MSRPTVASRFTAALLAGLLAGLPSVPVRANPTSVGEQSYTVGDGSATGKQAQTGTAAKNAKNTREAPVDSTGSFTHSIPLELPPGRLEMTPSLTLSYSSGASKEGSPFGAGWSLSVPRIERSTMEGYPSVSKTGNVIKYNGTEFQTHAGVVKKLVDASGQKITSEIPTTAVYDIYAPVREYEPVRFEFNQVADTWTEHAPNGRKRYYGRNKASTVNGRIVNDLGTFAWMLLEEVDPYGNTITYDYHYISDQTRSNKTQFQIEPILKTVVWGANPVTGVGAQHKVDINLRTDWVETYASTGLRGGTRSMGFVSDIDIGDAASGSVFWSYDLTMVRSKDTNRPLLTTVTRTGGTTPRITTLSYTNNDGVTTRWSPAVVLSDNGTVPERLYAETVVASNEFCSIAEMLGSDVTTPRGKRSGFQFMDFDGNGETDVVYHPAGVGAGASNISYQDSTLRVDGQWGTLSTSLLDWPTHGPGENLYKRKQQLADFDGDGDVDTVFFPMLLSVVNNREDLLGELVGEDLCSSPAFWDQCGAVDPVSEPFEECYGGAGRECFESTWDPEMVNAFDYVIYPAFSVLNEIVPIVNMQAYTGGGGLTCLSLIRACNASRGGAGSFAPYYPIGLPFTLLRNSAILDQDLADGHGITSHNLAAWPAAVQTVLYEAQWDTIVCPTETPVSDVVADFSAPAVDLNGDGKSEIVLLKWTHQTKGTTFVPRAYRHDGHGQMTYDGSDLDTEDYSGFTVSLNLSMHGSDIIPEFCSGSSCTDRYPWYSNHNAILNDFTGDGLPDLVLAERPSAGRCVHGHRLYPNIGWRFAYAGEPTVLPGETYTPTDFSAATSSHPFLRLRNHATTCEHTGFTEPIVNTGGVLNMGAMSSVDLNADGLLDLVFASERTDGSDRVENVYLNTGSGFVRPTNSVYANFYAPSSSSIFPLHPLVDSQTRYFASEVGVADLRSRNPDTGRMVDVDDDGLVDLVHPGVCYLDNIGGPGEFEYVTDCGSSPTTSWPTRWQRNVLKHPDLLEKVETTGGAWTKASYVAAKSREARIGQVTSDVGAAPSGMLVVKEITRSSGPTSVAGNLGAHSRTYPVEEITMSYTGYVRDIESKEAVGFEIVEATFQNAGSPDAASEQVVVDRVFEVSPTIGSTAFSYPLRGQLASVTTQGLSTVSSWQSESTFAYDVTALGANSVRIRPVSEYSRDCEGGTCSFGRTSQTTSFGAFGLPLQTKEYAGPPAGSPPSPLIRSSTYANDTAGWVLGLVASETTQGRSYDINGSLFYFAEISKVDYTYDIGGQVASVVYPATGAAVTTCGEPLANAFRKVFRTYHPDGLLWKERNAKRYPYESTDRFENESVYTYGGRKLFPSQEATTYRAVEGGVGVADRVLTTLFEFDRRFGVMTQRTDPNGVVWIAGYDTLGRMTSEHYNAGTQIQLRSIAYDQSTAANGFPLVERETHYTDQGVSYEERTFLDGAGKILAQTRGAASVGYQRAQYHQYDAFGRPYYSYLPRTASSLTDSGLSGGEGASQRRSTRYDGVDRPAEVVLPDTSLLTYDYAPDSVLETDPRGNAILKTYDWHGDLSEERRYDASNALLASYTYQRNGLGQVNSITTSSGDVRRFEYDKNGQRIKLTLPHATGTTPDVFLTCPDIGGGARVTLTPQGRRLTIDRDGLGRPSKVTNVYTVSGSPVTETSLLNYDSSVATDRGKGRLRNLVDKTGTWTHRYDPFGRRSWSELVPGTALGTGFASAYSGTFTFNHLGGIKSASYSGFGGAVSFAVNRDAKGRPSSVTTTAPDTTRTVVSSVTYDQEDRPNVATYGNGNRTDWDYSATRGFPTKIVHEVTSSGVDLASIDYLYDENGNIESETRTAPSGRMTSTKAFQYDEMDRLKRIDWTSTSAFPATTYSYKGTGEILTAGGETYTYGDSKRRQATTQIANPAVGLTRTMVYDNDGFLVQKTSVKTGSSTVTLAANYDAIGCPAKFTHTVGSTAKTFDTFCTTEGQEVFRKQTVSGSTVQRILNFDQYLQIRPNTSNALLRLPLGPTNFLEESRALTTGALATNSDSGYLHTDLRGSVIERTSVTGTTVSREADYGPWGEIVNGPNVAPPDRGWLDEESYEGTSFRHIGRRVYDVELRRWLTPDPLLFSEAELGRTSELDLFGYAGGNPVKYTDSSGTSVWSKAAKVVVKVAKGADAADAFADNVQDVATIVSPAATPVQKVVAAASLASEALPVSVSDLKDGYRAFKALEKVAKRLDDSPIGEIAKAAKKGGETAATKDGRRAHKAYKDALGDGYDYDKALPSGLRPDAVDVAKGEVRELKPDNPAAIRKGWAQLKKYATELEEVYGKKFEMFLDTYQSKKP